MHKFKNDGSGMIPEKTRKLYLITTIALLIFVVVKDIIIAKIYVLDIVSIALGVCVLWGIQFNGAYKIARKIMEWKLTRKDNKFDYRSWDRR